jgi:hypothetical protein
MGVKCKNYMNFEKINNSSFTATLITKGRKTGNDHSVWLKAVMYDNKIYFSRRNPDGDWLKNAITNSDVKVEFSEKKFDGLASLVKDETLVKKISSLKYLDKKRQEESRIVLEVTLREQ